MLDFLFGDSSLRFVVPSMVSSVAGYAFFTLPFVTYILARWRQQREAVADPQLGVKVAIGYFAFAGSQVALAGTVLVLYANVTKSEDHGDILRAGFAFLLPGLMVWIAHRVAMARTNGDEFPGVRRLVAGLSLVLCSALGFASLVFTFQALFAKGSSGEAGRFAVSAAVVYLPAWGFHAWRVFSDRLGMAIGPPLEPAIGDRRSAIGQTQIEPAAPPPVADSRPPTADGPSLPSLGGGAFPPIK